jgi:DNA replication protein DnaC
MEELAKSLNVNLGHTFENFGNVPGVKGIVQAFKSVISGPRFMLLIYSGVGNGKTHLLEASSIELYKQGKFCRVLSFSRILSTLKAAINNPSMDYEEILNNYTYADRLIIDDIGAGGSDTEFGDKILETIVCARYGRGLLTIMSTNRDIESLPERVKSRLKDKTSSFLILNKAEDYRSKLEVKKEH